MDVFVIEQSIDLSGVNMPMIYLQALTQHDAYAHEWRVSVKKHGHAVDLTGCTAQIYFGPENKTGDGIVPGEALTQRATTQGGAAYAQLLPELYQIDGRVMAIMQISDPEDHVMTAAVLRLHTSGVLEGDIGDPSGSVIEMGALLAQLDELRTQTSAAREAAQTANTAAENADAAANSADEAASAANKASVSANSASNVARTEAGRAYEAASAANTAASAANSAASSAETAAQNANAATQNANTATENANTATENANTATENANAAADSANEAASAANKASVSANSASNVARTEAGRAYEAASAANTAASAANSAASSAETAAQNANAATQASLTQQEAVAEAEAARDTAEQERQDAEQARQETFAGYEERIVAATPDDTKVNGRAWTSKKTVDSLCMPLEATGNPVQVYPVEGYPLGVKVNWEPVQAGEGDPSPDNIRPIIGRDAVSVTRCEENLLNISQLKPEGYNLAGINTLKPNTTYTFKPVSCGGIDFAVFLTDNIVPSQTTKQLNLTRKYIKEGESETFTTPSNSDSYSVMWLAGSKSGINQVYPNVQFMLVAGTTAPTTYTPYIGQTNTLTLPETVYGGTLDVETGVVTVDRAVIKPDGDSLKFTPSESEDFWNLPKYSAHGVLQTSSYTGLIVSSHFNKKFSSNETHEFIFTSARNMSGLYDTVDDFNTYIAAQYAAGTPVQIVYPLKEPRTIQLDKHQIAALSGVNTLYTDAGTLTVTGREDPRHTIVTLTDRIAALESAAAGV